MNPVPTSNSGPNESQRLTIVMVYEDYATGKLAQQIFGNVAEQLGPDCGLDHQMWKFDLLRSPRLQELAAEEAAEAIMIIIAAHGDAQLPDEVKTWITKWSSMKRTHPSALVALFDGNNLSPHDRVATRSYLQHVAQTERMDFFCNEVNAPAVS